MGDKAMRIKLAILENDQNYLKRIVSVFSTKYADKLEVYSFTDRELAFQTLDKSRIDVFLSGEVFDIDTDLIPKYCGFSYLVNSPGVESCRNQRAICKFQKVDLIYKQILSIYSDNAGSISGLKLGDDSTKVIVFSSPGGGAGTSSAAAGCAVHYARQNKKTLYLNLEKYGSSDIFFSADGMFNMSDVIFALKSKKSNIAMKLESCVKQAESGVYFYSRSQVALDMQELDREDVLRLISELKLTGSYDYIILDMDFNMDKDTMDIYRQAHAAVWVGDGSEISNIKLQRAYEALCLMEQNSEEMLSRRLCLVYNRFSSKAGRTAQGIDIKNIGGIPVYVHADARQVVEQIAPMSMFDKII